MSDTPPAPPRFWREVRNHHPDYVHWFVADTLSALGAALTSVPMSMVTLYITGSLAQAGVVGAVSSAGVMLMAIPAGMIIDSFDKKKLLFFYGLAGVLIWGVFSLLFVLDLFTFPLLLLFSAVSGLIMGTFGGLTNAILRFIVPERLLVPAQGRNQTRDSVVWMCGLPLGGLLYGLIPVLPFVVKMICGFGPLWASRVIRTPLRAERDPAVDSAPSPLQTFWSDLRYSLTWIFRYPALRWIFATEVASYFSNFFLISAVDLWLVYLGVAGWIIGATNAMFTLGMIAGGLLQDRLIRWFPRGNIIRFCLAWELAWYGLLVAFASHWQFIAVAAFFIVIPSVANNSFGGGFLALSAPPEKIGKCAAGPRLLVGLLPVLASAAAGFMLAAWNFQLSMILCVICSILGLLAAANPIFSTMPTSDNFDTIEVCH
ncbi:Major Facilitator Superfamily protein [Corynebacterium ciconiae DSM 44920]|uniref:MFS transporter n=1 Tax=Corynebacterium ciconiae TaxID=227319 RepID=UPI0003618DA4|nr:MFS transporter [Corynebacterium ciconiae]WKD62054.1 Major Facilitator Superfamily protein [Corynebacterium ciconiae DSM 44920]